MTDSTAPSPGELGQVTYDAFRNNMPGKLPEWKDVPVGTQLAWIQAADAARRA